MASLANVQLDVTTRLGALERFTGTGLASLDDAIGGGLRHGDFCLLAGAPGVGKTSLALLWAYMAARAKAGVVFSGVHLDDSEIYARLAARALHRDYENAHATYGTIWSGRAWQEPALRTPVRESTEQVVRKVGQHLHVHRASPLDSTGKVALMANQLMQRHEQVVVVLDGLEGYAAEGKPQTREIVNANFESRMSLMAFELRALAERGCIVVGTCQGPAAQSLAPAATLYATLSRGELPSGAPQSSTTLPATLSLEKNRSGPALSIALDYQPRASVFEERP